MVVAWSLRPIAGAKVSNVLPWSYSSLSAFETCPRRFYLTRIAKVVKEPQTEATIWGNEVHKALENAVKGVAALPERFKSYGPIVTRIKGFPGQKHAEQKFALTKAFKPTTFFASDAWFRGVTDLTLISKDKSKAAVLDYKTGKIKTDGDQLKLFAGATFAAHPYIEEVNTAYVWLGGDKVTSATFTKEDVPLIWQEFIPRVQRMEAAQKNNKWVPNPSGLCRQWCPVGKKLCEFCGQD